VITLLSVYPSIFVYLSIYEINLLSMCLSPFFPFSIRYVSYQHKVGDKFFPELLVSIISILYLMAVLTSYRKVGHLSHIYPKPSVRRKELAAV
jgi:hypothetical protein